jgi:hypothetical protein
VVKLVETTELAGGLTSFRTEIDVVDTSTSLEARYQHYKNLLENDGQATVTDQPSTARE